ncbi:sigma-E processing peptidase SpoIIGA [Paenibacillus sp. F411]|uniref:sigma-E processing peptidase SpoIIGA n=1 Tax=Paenibacillus sp. F411 TaxID=2820239 RepID=UPI001AAF9F03|nr:sigma-E processing peptidase SpoIIGA [Paenibacillus sp. F411]MBO2943198.1 sigma-E processing peptidase SpoIIGA [Paenibacillus sp. F411]
MVYIDLIFLVNLIIDGLLLALTAWMRKIKPKRWRLLLSAFTGAMYVLMMFLPPFSFLFTFVIKFVLSLAMLWIAFGFVSLQSYLRNLGTFYMVNFAAAGGIVGFHYLLQSSGELFSGIWYTASGGLTFELKISFWFIAIGFFAAITLFRAVQTSRRQVEQRETLLGEVTVVMGDVTVSCTGLLDTGNQLSDPLTRMPVMVMEASLWEESIPSSWRARLSEPDKLILELGEAAGELQDRLRLVPYRGINRGAAFMLAMKPDRARIVMNGEVHESARLLIGLDGGALSSDGAYRAIIHPELASSPVEEIRSEKPKSATSSAM